MLARAALFSAVTLGANLACGSAELHIAGAPPASQYVTSFDGRPASVELGRVRFQGDVCKGLDVTPVGRPLDADDFVAFARSQNLETRLVRARQDLVFVDLVNSGAAAPVRFRVAILGTPGAAGRELHTALLQQGRGSWGLHRGNLAVLAPTARPEDAVAMAGKLRLACWGVFMIAGHDDTFVVPGGYTEL